MGVLLFLFCFCSVFRVLCEHIEDPEAVSGLAERLTQAIRQPFECNGMTMHPTASIGIALGHGSTHSADDLLRFADTAIHEGKRARPDGWTFFNGELQAKAQLRMRVTHGLRSAIANDELSLRFQPIIETATGRIVGAEVLLRWLPEDGEIPPSVFIPVAEATGAIIPIGGWVLREGFRKAAEWRERWGARAPDCISINVSARQLDGPDPAAEIEAMLRETGADPSHVLIEVTETALMTHADSNVHVLRQLAELGLRVAVDDFGAGYSSLAQLTRLPVNVLKIDRTFIAEMDKGPEGSAVVRAVIGLGRALGLKMVAEGVETEAQLRELKALACDYVQGFLFHRPLTEADFIAAMDRQIG